MKPLLLHACCAPCSLEPVHLLREEGGLNPQFAGPIPIFSRTMNGSAAWTSCAGGVPMATSSLSRRGRTAMAGRSAWPRWAPIDPVAVARAMPCVWPRHAVWLRSVGLSCGHDARRLAVSVVRNLQ